MSKFFYVSDVLNIRDKNGKEPQIILITSNRSSGKTTAILSYFLSENEKDGSQFCLIFRRKYELRDCHNIFNEILERERKDYELSSKTIAEGLINTIIKKTSDEKVNVIGYAVALSTSDELKKYSPIFSRVERAVMDEYQLENEKKYLKNEIKALLSVLATISRGQGKAFRNVKLFLLGNKINLLNPYYIYFKIYERLDDKTKCIKGDGWISYHFHNKEVVEEMENASGLSFMADSVSYYKQDEYLYNMTHFIGRKKGKSNYLFTLISDLGFLGVREFSDGSIYVSSKAEETARYIFSIESGEKKNANSFYLNKRVFKLFKDEYENSNLYFENAEIKNEILRCLGNIRA